MAIIRPRSPQNGQCVWPLKARRCVSDDFKGKAPHFMEDGSPRPWAMERGTGSTNITLHILSLLVSPGPRPS